jgi:hypothetical protein
MDLYPSKFAALDRICFNLKRVEGQCHEIATRVEAPIPTASSIDRPHYIALITYLQFRHPQYSYVLSLIKEIRPGGGELILPYRTQEDLISVLAPYLPLEVSFMQLSDRFAVTANTRLTTFDPEYPIRGISLTTYCIMVETASECDELVIRRKCKIHSSSPNTCLSDGVNMLNMSPRTSLTHRRSRSSTLVASLFRRSVGQS